MTFRKKEAAMRRIVSILVLSSAIHGSVFAQPLNPPANLYIVSNSRTDLVAAFASLDRCQAAAAAHKTTVVGNGAVPMLLLCVPTQ
jgi:hypothetical protein